MPNSDRGFEASFSGVCGNCGLRYPPGTRIVRHAGGWAHAACPADPMTLPAQKGEVACKRCFLIHPEGACDA